MSVCCLAASMSAQPAPLPLKMRPWQLYTYTPGPGREIRYSSDLQQVPFSRSINELIDNGYVFRDSAGRPIASNAVEHHYWRYRTVLPSSSGFKQYRNLSILVENPEPYSLYLMDGKPVSLAYANHMPVWKAVSTSLLTDSVLIDVQLPSLYDAGVQDLQRSGSSKWPADNDTGMFKTSVVLRKPPVQFGWDVAPRRVLNGLGSGVKFFAFDHMSVLDVWSNTQYITPGEARIKMRWLIYADSGVYTRFLMKISGGAETVSLDTTLQLMAGQQAYEFEVSVKNPVLWNGIQNCVWGGGGVTKPFLYDLQLQAVSGRDSFMHRRALGLRTVELKQNIDLRGREFRFALNGKPVFIRGANLLPTYGFGGQALEDKLWRGPNSLLKQMASTGYNMVRVWGGGGLMPDDFYSQCDSLGLLVWHDLMYSGSVYPYEAMWKRRALSGALAMVERLRNHPCMALYCGNNEIDVALDHWGWEKTYNWSSEDSLYMRQQHNGFFHRDLPLLMKEADAGTPYLATSPQSNWAPTDEMRYGDNHLWFVWHGERPVTDLDRIVPRFASEYGMPSWPSYATVRKHFSTGKPEQHMLSYKGLALLNRYMKDEFGSLPTDTHAIILLSQYLQARTLVRAARAHMADTTCGGTLYWQLNDIWPGITWSTVDYEGYKKAAWFAMNGEYCSNPFQRLNLSIDPAGLSNPGLKIKRKGRMLELRCKSAALGVMILVDGHLLDAYVNGFDMVPGSTRSLLLPEGTGKVEITTVWHLLNNQGFIRK